MKREEPWQIAKRAADKAELQRTRDRLSAEAARQRAAYRAPFDPMGIAWGDTEPLPDPPSKPGRRKR